MKKVLIYYSFLLTSIMTVLGFVGAASFAELFSAILFFPLSFYFLRIILPQKKHALIIPEINIAQLAKVEETDNQAVGKPIKLQRRLDMDRRMFVKLIGSAGLSVFFLAIFTRKAHGAFFGSVPGPGTVALKDTTGAQIDPAQNHPTDGYKVAELDDSSPAYYGFVNKDGAWFILKEESSGAYRYFKGTSNFATNWTGRAALSYDYYHNIF